MFIIGSAYIYIYIHPLRLETSQIGTGDSPQLGSRPNICAPLADAMQKVATNYASANT